MQIRAWQGMRQTQLRWALLACGSICRYNCTFATGTLAQPQKRLNISNEPVMKILVVEDEPKVAGFIKQGLEEEGYSVTQAADGRTGRDLALQQVFDLVILDVMLPEVNGLDICRQIRQANKAVPVLMLTALGTTDDKVSGLDAGADDYITKPFAFNELLARVRALLRRKQLQPAGTTLTAFDLELDPLAKTVKRADQHIALTAKEFSLLEYFMKNKNRVLSRAEIAKDVWNLTFDTGTNFVDVYVNYLRNKVDKNYSVKLIHTVVGMGYVLRDANG